MMVITEGIVPLRPYIAEVRNINTYANDKALQANKEDNMEAVYSLTNKLNLMKARNRANRLNERLLKLNLRPITI